MKTFGAARLTVLGTMAAAMFSSSVLVSAASDVLDLGESNFSKRILSEPLALVEFYAPWCGHCKALAPHYEAAATELKELNIPVAKVNCVDEQTLCDEYGVQGYPSIKVFSEGTPSDYQGQRTTEDIVSHVKRLKLPAVTDLTADKLADFKSSEKAVIVGYFDEKNSAAYQTFEAVAKQLRDKLTFGAVLDDNTAKAEGLTAPAVAVYTADSDEPFTLSGADAITALPDLRKFVEVNSLPLLDDIGQHNYAAYMGAGLPLAFIFHIDDDMKKELTDIFTPVAKKFRGKANLVLIDANTFAKQADFLNLREQWPAVGVLGTTGLKYPMDQNKNITAETADDFFTRLAAGEATPFVKSGPIPEDNSGPVKVIVADEFEKIVMDPSKDVLIEFYAPWCGHCKKLAPVWEELGEKYADHPSIVVAKLDGTENDVPVKPEDFQIQGFPTIKLVKRGTNEVVEYSGDRSLETFEEFLSTHVAPAGVVEKVEELAGDVKDAAAAKVAETGEKAEELKDAAAAKAGDAKEAAKDTAEAAAQKASEIKDAAAEKLAEAKSKVTELKEAFADSVGHAKDVAALKLAEAEVTVAELQAAAAEKAGEAKDAAAKKLAKAEAKVAELKAAAEEKAAEAKETLAGAIHDEL
ncbi:protein disulfide-isomerase precursor [Tieghemiomyces parasiticus]|uniref:Protein disulfide-isomerase n=1 Tax=Tieghemiomyces parasiticus TaxID=78921 RepID=A0A9W8A2Z4_9FUNG|nr:protein disulfide-isomerase precursor [Tieghemiomyces parasiticus]